MGAKTVIASGAMWNAKGDVRSDKFLIECKTTKEGYYSVTAKVWDKISMEATSDHLRIPLLVVDLRDTDRYIIFDPVHFEPKEFITEELKGVGLTKVSSCRFYGYEYPTELITINILGRYQRHVLVALRYDDFVSIYKDEI